VADPKDSTSVPSPDPANREATRVAVAPAESVSADGGWKTQSPWLKLVLFLSLVFVATGVYRCSSELTPVEDPGTIRVERATVDVPDSLVAVPPDSFAALATRLFVRGLRSAAEADVSVGEDPSAWAVVRLHVRGRPDGRVDLTGVASSAVGGGRLAIVTVDDTPDRLREIAAEAARRVARELNVAGAGSADSTSQTEAP
jgi:hypothetical protein